MQKKIRLCTVFILGILIIACNLQPASSIRIKTSPEFNASLGSRTDDLAQLVKGKLDDALKGKDIKAYYYSPDGEAGNTTRYLIHYPIKEVDLNINDLLAKNIAPSFEKQFPSKTFTIPAIHETKTQTVNMTQLNAKLIETFKMNIPHQLDSALIALIKAALTTTSNDPVEQELPEFDISFPNSKTITFGAGSTVKLTITPTNITSKVSKATLISNGVSIPGVVQSNGEVHFDVSGKTITNPAKLKCTVSVSSIQDNASITIASELSNTSKIEKATGITMTTDIGSSSGLTPQTIAVPENEYFISGAIKTGSITINNPVPSSWTNVTLQKSITITQPDGIAINQSPATYTDLTAPILLDGQKVSKNAITVTPAIKVTMQDATYVYTDSLSITVTFTIEEFASVTLKQPDEITNPQKIEHSAAGIKEMVEKIQFKNNNPKITVTLTHNLPGDIGLTLTSDAFKINSQKNFPQGEHTEEFASTETPLTITLDTSFNAFDVTPTITLPGAADTNGTKTFTLTNVKLGTQVAFSGKVAVSADWEKVTLNNIDKDLQTGEPIDLEALSRYLKTSKYEIDILECPMHFYFSAQALKNKNITPKMLLTANVTDAHNALSTKTIFGKPAATSGTYEATEIRITSEQLNLGEKSVITAIPDPSFSIKKQEENVQCTFAELVNNKPNKIKLTCHLSMQGVELSQDEVEKLKENSKIQIAVLIDVPLGAKFKNKIDNVPIQDLVEDLLDGSSKTEFKKHFEKDLFSRESASASSNKFLEFIATAAIDLSMHNPLEKPVTALFDLQDQAGNSVLAEKKQIMLKPGNSSQVISFTQEEIQKIAKTVPCKPSFTLTLDDGDYTVAKNAKCTVSMSIRSKLDIDYKIK